MAHPKNGCIEGECEWCKALQTKLSRMKEALASVIHESDKWLHGCEDTFQTMKDLHEIAQQAIDDMEVEG